MIVTLIHSRSPLENHTRFQTKAGKVIPVFKPKRPKTLPFGTAHTYMAYIREYPPPHPPPPHELKSGLNLAYISSVFFRCLNASARVTERYVRSQKKVEELRLPPPHPPPPPLK